MQSAQPEENESELIARYKQTGSLDVLGKLYEPYMSLVYGVSLKYLKDRDESQDMVMQIFEKLVVAVKDYDISNFKSWLYVTSKNQCLMALRAKKGKHFEEISPFIMESGAEMHHDQNNEMESNLSKLEKCIEELGGEQKACVKLFYIEERCYKEITEQTGYDFNKVKSHIQNGKRNLKLCMEKNA